MEFGGPNDPDRLISEPNRGTLHGPFGGNRDQCETSPRTGPSLHMRVG